MLKLKISIFYIFFASLGICASAINSIVPQARDFVKCDKKILSAPNFYIFSPLGLRRAAANLGFHSLIFTIFIVFPCFRFHLVFTKFCRNFATIRNREIDFRGNARPAIFQKK